MSPILALANFQGAKDEFQRARNALLDGNARDAIFYAGASVEIVFKAALPSGSSTICGRRIGRRMGRGICFTTICGARRLAMLCCRLQAV